MKTKVIQGEVEIQTEVLADSIKSISDGVKRMRSGKLNDRAIFILISKASNEPLETVKRVVLGMESLERMFLK